LGCSRKFDGCRKKHLNKKIQNFLLQLLVLINVMSSITPRALSTLAISFTLNKFLFCSVVRILGECKIEYCYANTTIMQFTKQDNECYIYIYIYIYYKCINIFFIFNKILIFLCGLTCSTSHI